MLFSLSKLTLLAISILNIQKLHAADSGQWRTRSIYQVFTDRFARADSSRSASCPEGFQGYCGGTWRGIIDKLDYIQGMGFTAIWISPIVAQIEDESRAYHGYSASNLNALNSHFGTATDLVALAKALHGRNMYLMVDIVVNHMGWDGLANKTDFDTLDPFNDRKFYHNICWIEHFDNQTEVEKECSNCWLGTDVHPLPDIDTTRSDVRDIFSSWIKSLVSLYSIDGLRLDTVKHVEKDFWPTFNSASGVFNLGEVADGNVDFVCPYQGYLDGVLDYPSFYQSTLFFSNTSQTSENFIKELQHLNSNCSDPTLMASFSENHDQPRFASLNSDLTLAKNILTYTMLSDSIPIVYQGQEFHFASPMDPFNREALWLPNNTLTPNAYSTPYSTDSPLYKHISTLNKLRTLAQTQSRNYATSRSRIIYSDTNTIVFQRGDTDFTTMIIVNNLGSKAPKRKLTIGNTGMKKGLRMMDVLTCQNMKVDDKGGVTVDVEKGEPLVLYSHDFKHGTQICKATAAGFAVGLFKTASVALLLSWILL